MANYLPNNSAPYSDDADRASRPTCFCPGVKRNYKLLGPFWPLPLTFCDLSPRVIDCIVITILGRGHPWDPSIEGLEFYAWVYRSVMPWMPLLPTNHTFHTYPVSPWILILKTKRQNISLWNPIFVFFRKATSLKFGVRNFVLGHQPVLLPSHKGGKEGVCSTKDLTGVVQQTRIAKSASWYQWPCIKCQLWYMSGPIFSKFCIISVAVWKWVIGSYFLGKLLYILYWSIFKFLAAHPYQNQPWVPTPALSCYDTAWV